MKLSSFLTAPISATLYRMQSSVGIAPPTAAMRTQEDLTACPLLRRLPTLQNQLAWRELGDNFPTPVHVTSVALESGNRVKFYVKREDLSSAVYGGNKVRTLQFQLAVIESRLEAGEPDVRPITVLGTWGSNQNVATVVHASQAVPELVPSINVALLEPDVADLDNTLNVLSVLSIGRTKPLINILGSLPSIARAAFLGRGTVLTLGGNSPSGCLGQVSGMLELAEQIESGAAPDPDRIYLAMGSSCTISGLIIGVALSRHLGLRAFASPRFCIHGVIVHHIFGFLQRHFDFHRQWESLPLTISQTIRETCATMASIGGPDVTSSALQILAAQVHLNDDKALCAKYGGHSERSRAASELYDATGHTYSVGSDGKEIAEPPLWLCGHFVAKPFAAMLADLDAAEQMDEPMQCLLWQTKSAVQPRGQTDEWARFTHEMPAHMHTWAAAGPAESSLRPGKVDPFGGEPKDYRRGMVSVPLD